MDNLNTHTTSLLYEAFLPEKARALAKRLEIHYTPKHGSWLNITEIELNAMASQCLGRRVPDINTLSTELEAWYITYNNSSSIVKWHFTTDKARSKLRKLFQMIWMTQDTRRK